MSNMRFKISARVISHLGLELISSDEIAIFELVKNGFDARSKKVVININYRVDITFVNSLVTYVNECDLPLRKLQDQILAKIRGARNGHDVYCTLEDDDYFQLQDDMHASSCAFEFIELLEKLNCIEISDTGDGMTPDEVQDYYFTVGTLHRSKQVRELMTENSNERPPSGEKGIGRLSAMRLGSRLDLITVSSRSPKRTIVSLDWNKFFSSAEEDASSIPVFSKVMPSRTSTSGTTLRIFGLNENWDRRKVNSLASNHLAKFIDPFPSGNIANRIALRWNGDFIDTKARLKTYLDACQNYMEVSFDVGEKMPCLNSVIRLGPTATRSSVKFNRCYTALDFSGFTEDDLRKIGPFELYLYHFPRNRLKAIPGVATRIEIKKWLDHWSGGLMIFRDGIRVMPYGEKNDDWLDLDGQALRGKGFRVNRIQVVGCVRISRIHNACLQDQTNREGMIDNETFRLFRRLVVQHIRQNFVNAIDEHWNAEKSDPQQLAVSVETEYETLVSAASKLEKAVKSKEWESVIRANRLVQDRVGKFKQINVVIDQWLNKKERDSIEVMELAASGMSAESMAHDLEGVTKQSVASLDSFARSLNDNRILESVRHIRAVHKAILTQIGQLSPGPAKTRRRRSTFDVLKLIRETSSFYKEKMRRHSIEFVDHTNGQQCNVYAVSGHVRQVFDNLFQNSFFWLEDSCSKRAFGTTPLAIHLRCDPNTNTVYFSDSGCGIAVEDVEWVFQPFRSRRASGRGLGLYICREFCDFNKIDMVLLTDKKNRWGRFNTFSLTFDAGK